MMASAVWVRDLLDCSDVPWSWPRAEIPTQVPTYLGAAVTVRTPKLSE